MSRILHAILFSAGLALLAFMIAAVAKPPAALSSSEYIGSVEIEEADLQNLTVLKLEVGRDYAAYYNDSSNNSIRAHLEFSGNSDLLRNLSGTLILRTSNKEYIGSAKITYQSSYIACNPRASYSVSGGMFESEAITPAIPVAADDYVMGEVSLKTSVGDRVLSLPVSRMLAWR
jgi:hypothetical protein